MREKVDPFTTVMSLFILLVSSAALVLLGLEAHHLYTHRRRALAGILGMALVLTAAAVRRSWTPA